MPNDAPAAAAAQTQTSDGSAVAATVAAAAGAVAPAAAAPGSTSATQDSKGTNADGTAAATNDGAKGDAAKAGAPEKYEFKAPDGVKLDAEVIAEFSTIAKELGLSQDAAQKVVDKVAAKLAARGSQQATEAVTQMKTSWATSTKGDSELAGQDGKQLDATLAVAKRGLSAFGTPALNKLLADTGLGNHPEIIRAFWKAGKTVSEATHVQGAAKPTTGEVSAAEKLFGTNALK